MYSILVTPNVIICDLSVWSSSQIPMFVDMLWIGICFLCRSKYVLGQLWICSNRTEANTERRRGLLFFFIILYIYDINQIGPPYFAILKSFSGILNSLIIFRIDNVKVFFPLKYSLYLFAPSGSILRQKWRHFDIWLKSVKNFHFSILFFSNGNYRPTF